MRKIKKYARSFLAILCCTSMVAGSAGMLARTVKAAGTLPAETLPTDFTTVTPSDLGFDDGATTVKTKNSKTPLTTMDGVIFDADVEFTGANQWLGFHYGDTEFRFGIGGDNQFYVQNQYLFDTNPEGWSARHIVLSPATALGEGKTTFIEQGFNLKITTEIVNHDSGDTENDVKIGIWFNNKLYNNEYIYIKDGSAKLVANCYYLEKVYVTTPVPQVEQLPTDFTTVTPSQLGFANGATTEKTYNSSNPLSTMDGVIFDADVTFTGTNQWLGFYNGQWAEFRFGVGGDEKFYVQNRNSLFATNPEGWSTNYINLEPATALGEGKTTFINQGFNLKITTEFLNIDNGATENDVKIGVWFNNKLYNNEYIYIKDGSDKLVANCYYLDQVNVTTPVPQVEQLPTDFTTVTPSDLGFVGGATTEKTYNSLNPLTTADGVIFDADVTFTGANQWLGFHYGDKEFRFGIGGDNQFYVQNQYLFDTNPEGWTARHIVLSPATALGEGKTTFINQGFNLKITTEFVNIDNGATENDVKIGVWFNNTLYDNEYIYIKDGSDRLVANCYYLEKVSITTHVTQLEQLPTDFTTVTPSQLGFANGATTGRVNNTLSPLTTMNKVIFDADVKYTGIGQYIGYYSGQWVSMKIGTTGADEFSVLNDGLFNTEMLGWESGKLVFEPSVAIEDATTLVNKEFNLKVTTEQVDLDEDGTATDLKLGFWFNNKLYNNEYLYVVDGFAKLVNNAIYLNMVTVKSSNVEDETLEQLPTDFTVITPSDYGFEEVTGTLPQTWSTETPVQSMHKVMLNADVKYAPGNLGYANINTWYSLRFALGTGGFYLINEIAGNQGADFVMENIQFDPQRAIGKSTFADQEFNLKVTTEAVDSDTDGIQDDLKLGIWFNDRLYCNTYIYVQNGFGELGTEMYLKGEVFVSITPKQEEAVTPPTFPEITFSDFYIADGKYAFNAKDLAVVGKYKEGFANKTFVGTVNYSNEPTSSINLGGQASGWEGVQLKTFTDGNLYFAEAYARFKPVLIDKEKAGMDLTERNLDVKLSFEVTDLDGDQEADDVRFWLYLDGKLYKDKPIVKAIDYAQYLGNFLGIYANAEKTSVTITSKDLNRPKLEVDFSIVGFTKDWATTLGLNGKKPSDGNASNLLNAGNKSPYTADASMAGTYLVTSAVALATLLLLYYEKRRNVK